MKSTQGKLLAFLESRLGSQYKGYRWFLLPLLFSSERELASILSISDAEARAVRDSLHAEFKHPFDIVGSGEVAALGNPPPRALVPTGVPCIDELLGGGFRAGQTYHLFGPPASGKTELGYLAMLSFLRHPFGKEPSVAVIDTEHSFRPERLMQHSSGSVDLNKIFVATCYSAPHLVTLLGTVESMMRRGKFIPLLVIDSILPTSFQLNQDEPVKRQRMLLDLSERIWAISRDHGTCVVFTNHAAGDLPMPSSSNVLLGYSDHAIYTRKNELDQTLHEARSIKSAIGKEREARFHIGPAGITA
jgi:hypothetical protein